MGIENLDLEILPYKTVRVLSENYKTLRVLRIKKHTGQIFYEVQDKILFFPYETFSTLTEALEWAKRNDQ